MSIPWTEKIDLGKDYHSSLQQCIESRILNWIAHGMSTTTLVLKLRIQCIQVLSDSSYLHCRLMVWNWVGLQTKGKSIISSMPDLHPYHDGYVLKILLLQILIPSLSGFIFMGSSCLQKQDVSYGQSYYQMVPHTLVSGESRQFSFLSREPLWVSF